MKSTLLALLLSTWSSAAWADGADFSARLFPKFQVKACTTCHDFFEKKRGGLSFKSHEDRTPDTCVLCHSKEVTGFKHADDWFARPGLYTSGMNSKQTCEAIKKVLHAEFKSETLVARDIEKHLFEDARVLWAIEGATPNSGLLPEDKKEPDLVKAWIKGGMKCR